MNIYTAPERESKTSPRTFVIFSVLFVFVLCLVVFSFYFTHLRTSAPLIESNSETPNTLNDEYLTLIAEHWELTPSLFTRLATFLSSSDYSGSGAFRVKEPDISRYKNSILAGIDLSYSDVASAFVAAEQISSLTKQGFSEVDSMLFYVFGRDFSSSDPAVTELRNLLQDESSKN